jgi:hypothetical protein
VVAGGAAESDVNIKRGVSNNDTTHALVIGSAASTVLVIFCADALALTRETPCASVARACFDVGSRAAQITVRILRAVTAMRFGATDSCIFSE